MQPREKNENKATKENIKKLSRNAASLKNNQTPQVAGGQGPTQGICFSAGCDIVVYLGCKIGRACY
ncbi:hypothetical protein CWC18_16375 [Pseudoalteromonas aurantia]|uniref:Bacteriocin n=1 Tax=Pseudoalteromonas aurantia TaxID=43654 RepID=A0ABY2VSG4_9GAMM|nr:hypothetical protein CWC18_16375 [Pseudoalteromonas aurantia]TMO69942.1 hypothetical protein CWC20_20090 [Pseudoalteromonas aurantia]